MKKLPLIVAGLVVVGGAAVWFAIEGRFAVEGGRVLWAVKNDDTQMLRQGLAAGVEKEKLDEALGRAAFKSNAEQVKLLLEAGADPNPPRSRGSCILFSAARVGAVEVTRLLLEAGADPSTCKESGGEIATELVRYGFDRAPQAEVIRTLALFRAKGVDLTQEDKKVAPLAEAKRRKLDQVVAWIENPSAVAAPSAAASPEERPRGKSGSLTLDDLKEVCAGKALADAAPYVKKEQVASTVYYFERRHDSFRWPGRGPGMPSLPTWWTDWEDPSHTQLVACIDAVEKEVVKTCRYEGPGGGISIYDATWEITVYEAKSGRKLGSTRFAKKGPQRCDTTKRGRQQEGDFPPYSEELQAFLAEYVGGPK